MATITPTALTTAGVQPTFAAATGGGDTVAVGSNVYAKTTLIVRNGGASPITVTLTAVNACNQGSLHNVTVSCPNGQDTDIVLLPQVINLTTGNVAVGYSAVTSVTVAAIYN